MLPHTVPGCPVVLLPWVCTLLQQLYTLLHVTLLDYFSVPYRFYSHFTLLHFYSGLKHQKVWGTLVSSVPNCPPLHLFVQATPLVTVRFHSSLWLSCSLPKLRPDLRLMFRVKKLLSNWEIYHANKFNSTPFKQNLMHVLVHSRSYCWSINQKPAYQSKPQQSCEPWFLVIGCDLVLTTILEILKRPVVCQFVKRWLELVLSPILAIFPMTCSSQHSRRLLWQVEITLTQLFLNLYLSSFIKTRLGYIYFYRTQVRS